MRTIFVSLASILLLHTNTNATIIVALKLKDGVVIAADSRVTDYMSGTYEDNAEKLIVLDNCAVALFGLASVGSESLTQLTKDLRHKSKERELRERKHGEFYGLDYELQTLFEKKYSDWYKKSSIGYPGGYLIACFDEKTSAEIDRPILAWRYFAAHTENHSTTIGSMGRSYGVLVKGQTDVVSRLLYGVDEAVQIMDTKLLSDRGVLSALLTDTTRYNQFEMLKQVSYVIPYEKMSIEEGVEFAGFLAQTTITMQKYSRGTKVSPRPASGAGGAIDILTIQKDGLSWVHKKNVVR